ncbi:MAG: diguanylate cyclase [Halobacteria archaeon]|nr:diguanylate cyclase [Halobacteria archaeon]
MLKSLDTTQYQQLLEACPIGLLLIDKDDQIRWINPALRNWLGARADKIVEQEIDAVPRELQKLWAENATVHLSATDTDDEFWLLGTSQALNDGSKMQFFVDATASKLLLQERDVLQSQLESVSLTDEDTGMPNQRALSQNLESQVSRSRRYQNPLTILIMQVDNLDEFIKTQDTESVRPLLVAIRNMLNDQLRWADTIGRMTDNEFLLILPETHLEATEQMIELINQRLGDLYIEGFENSGFKVHARFGAAEWHKGDDVGLLMMRAREVLEETEKQTA